MKMKSPLCSNSTANFKTRTAEHQTQHGPLYAWGSVHLQRLHRREASPDCSAHNGRPNTQTHMHSPDKRVLSSGLGMVLDFTHVAPCLQRLWSPMAWMLTSAPPPTSYDFVLIISSLNPWSSVFEKRGEWEPTCGAVG